jgi:hypothetical protein
MCRALGTQFFIGRSERSEALELQQIDDGSETQRSTRPRRASSKQVLEVLGGVLALLTAGVVYFGQSEISARGSEIDRLKDDLNSIERTVGDASAFDLTSIVVSSADRQSVPSDYAYIESDRFHVSPSIEQDWKYGRVSEHEYWRSAGVSEEQIPEALKGVDLNLWRRPDTHVIEDPSGKFLANAYTSVTLERTTPEQVIDVFREQYSDDVASSGLVSSIESRAEDDFASFVVQTQLITQPPIVMIDSSADIANVLGPMQRGSGIPNMRSAAFAQVDTVFQNVVVDGVAVDEYSIQQEMFVFDFESEVVLISTRVPSSEQADADSGRVNVLLNSLRIE